MYCVEVGGNIDHIMIKQLYKYIYCMLSGIDVIIRAFR